MRLGVFGRFLLITSSLSLFAFSLVVVALQVGDYRQAKQELEQKLNSISSAYALILASPMAQGQYDQLSNQTLSILIDKEVAAFSVSDINGRIIDSFGLFEHNNPYDKTVFIRFADESGLQTVGEFRLQMSAQELELSVFHRSLVILSFIFLAFLASIAAAASAYWVAVGKPLNKLFSAIRTFQLDGEHSDVPVQASDQLGKVVKEYNRMQRMGLKQQERLADSHDGLEREVSDRTQELREKQESLKKAVDRLSYLEMHDELTGLPNHRAFQEKVRMWMLDKSEVSKSAAICVLGLDRFSQINAEVGHHGGDAFLTSVAQLIQLCSSQQDFLARLAGDEFVLFLNDRSVQEFKQICLDLLSEVSRHRFESVDNKLQTTLSIGISILSEDEISYDKTLSRAEMACRQAKNEGGNRLVIIES